MLCGLTPPLNLCLLAYRSLYPGTTLDLSGNNVTRWWQQEASCLRCPKRVTFKSGIICANYGLARGLFPVCESAYCGTCFEPHGLDQFEVRVPCDFHGVSLAEVEDELRFGLIRPGNHLCSTFQCPNCQSQNARGRSLVIGDAQDKAFEAMATRATLDAFWTHTSRTERWFSVRLL